jgi:hypothetical protein
MTADIPDVDLGLSAEVDFYLRSRGFGEPSSPPLVATPEPSGVAGAVFDPDRVDRVIAVFRALRHTQGALAGQALEPDPWQVAYLIAPIFGWVRPDGRGGYVRIIREVWAELPRKNGKTTIAGAIAIYLTAADNEAGAQVIAAATTKDQAGFCFRPIKQLAEQSPLLRKHVKAYQSKIVHRRSGSSFMAISAIADAQHGANIAGAIIDEVHLHKDAELIEAIETGTGSRSQPLVFMITTADDGRPNSIYSRKRHRIEQLADGVLHDPTTYGVIWAAARSEADLTDDPFSADTLRRANPGYGVSPTAEYLERGRAEGQGERRRAGHLPAAAPGGADPADRPVHPAGPVGRLRRDGRRDPAGRPGLLGRARPVVRGGPHRAGVAVPRPRRRPLRGPVPVLAARGPAAEPVPAHRRGRRRVGAARLPEAHPGNVIDNEAVLHTVDADARRFRVQTMGYDRWGATDVVRRLGEDGDDLRRGRAGLRRPVGAVEGAAAADAAAASSSTAATR